MGRLTRNGLIMFKIVTQPAFTCSKSTIETSELYVKSVQN